LTECLTAVWHRQAENDDYNAVVLNAGLSWRDAALLRSVAHYLHQTGTPYAQHYMAQTLNRHPSVARLIIQFFSVRFDPKNLDEAGATAVLRDCEAELEKVDSLDEDRIIRRIVNVVDTMLRTNFFQTTADGRPNDVISFKLDARRIEGLPEPRPFREIFLHSPRVEGLHLRFGKVARGGIRWSDRPQDFRTEILGLVKAQQVKNAVIVPVGAKGGFVPKFLPVGGSREAVLAEGKAAYRIFIGTLLDLTDNLDGDTLVPPRGVVRRDEDDPYLVVAADKGTATFSDIANGIAVSRGFWLGDGFASGGSSG
jgi:glutamate dehydrogenase